MNEYAKSPPILRAGYISTTEAAARLGVTRTRSAAGLRKASSRDGGSERSSSASMRIPWRKSPKANPFTRMPEKGERPEVARPRAVLTEEDPTNTKSSLR